MDDANGRVAAGQICRAAPSIAEKSRRAAGVTEAHASRGRSGEPVAALLLTSQRQP
jgi:hypothetical protein